MLFRSKEAADKETGKEIEETSEQPAQVEAVPAEPATEEVKATEEKPVEEAKTEEPAKEEKPAKKGKAKSKE